MSEVALGLEPIFSMFLSALFVLNGEHGELAGSPALISIYIVKRFS